MGDCASRFFLCFSYKTSLDENCFVGFGALWAHCAWTANASPELEGGNTTQKYPSGESPDHASASTPIVLQSSRDTEAGPLLHRMEIESNMTQGLVVTIQWYRKKWKLIVGSSNFRSYCRGRLLEAGTSCSRLDSIPCSCTCRDGTTIGSSAGSRSLNAVSLRRIWSGSGINESLG